MPMTVASMPDDALGRRLRELREASTAPEPEPALVAEAAPLAPPPRQRLGELLVRKGLVSEDALEAALAEQRATGRPLGQILLAAGAVTEQNLARTLTEQNGFDSSASLRVRLAPGESGETYLLIEAGDPEPLYVADSFLDAADRAFEMIDRGEQRELAIVRDREGDRDCLWSYRPGETDSAQLVGHGAEDHPRLEEQ
jgi:hypothetical protein